MKSYLLNLYAYDLWANKRILDAILTNAIQDDKISRWFNHIINAERIWLERMQTGSFQTQVWGEVPSSALEERLNSTNQDILDWLNSLSEVELNNGIAKYSNSRGEAFETPWIGILAHVANHSTHHRGQIAARIRELGFVPPQTDYIFYLRRKAN
jgi:uncharacterized damage-inducible protein DinB